MKIKMLIIKTITSKSCLNKLKNIWGIELCMLQFFEVKSVQLEP